MKIRKIQYLAYDSNNMYIGTFEDEEYAQRWADKHGGYIDRHMIEREENRIYDGLLKDMVRKETAKEILTDFYLWIGQDFDDIPDGGFIHIMKEDFERRMKEFYKRYGVEVE